MTDNIMDTAEIKARLAKVYNNVDDEFVFNVLAEFDYDIAKELMLYDHYDLENPEAGKDNAYQIVYKVYDLFLEKIDAALEDG